MPWVAHHAMTEDEGEAFVRRWASGRDGRLGWFARVSGIEPAATRACLVEAFAWTIAWMDAGGATEAGDEYPIWFVPEGRPAPGISTGPALLVTDALAYLWVDQVVEAEPSLRLQRDASRTVGLNRPVLTSPDSPVTMCPYVMAHGCVRRLRDDEPARGVKRAGRDPEALASWSDVFLARVRGEGGYTAPYPGAG